MVKEIALKSRVNAPASRISEALREIPFDEFVAGHPLSPRALPRTDFFFRERACNTGGTKSLILFSGAWNCSGVQNPWH